MEVTRIGTRYSVFSGSTGAGKARGARERCRLLLAALLLLAVGAQLVACSYYRSFSSGKARLDFTFEYPRQWDRSLVEEYESLSSVTIAGREPPGPTSTAVKLFVHAWLGKGPQADEAARGILAVGLESRANIDEGIPRNFHLLEQGATTMDGATGHRAEYTFDVISGLHVPPGEPVYTIPTREILILVPRNGTVYEIEFSASQDEWERQAADIQHVLDTFRWK